ncbi:MAG: hypothetical protein KGR26_05860, partial [Cyanobacteria bacterium REEB65]|nr:hypothetical protein [Cyanobacteria bacterium REEB65]
MSKPKSWLGALGGGRTVLHARTTIGLLATVALLLVGCHAATSLSPGAAVPAVRGTVEFTASSTSAGPAALHTQALMSEVASASTVSLIDPTTGNTVASSVTDASGSFILTFSNFNPSNGSAYTLEAVKGLSVGQAPNRPGAAAVRIRTLLFWNNGWQSL